MFKTFRGRNQNFWVGVGGYQQSQAVLHSLEVPQYRLHLNFKRFNSFEFRTTHLLGSPSVQPWRGPADAWV